MELLLDELQRARLRELLARLDRIATVSLGHRAGLHLDEHSLVDQYMTILIAWEREVQGLSMCSTRQGVLLVDQPVEQAQSLRAARS